MTGPTLFSKGQLVYERFGMGEDAVNILATVTLAAGNVCTTDTGNSYDRLTGAAVPKGERYRTIHSERYAKTREEPVA